MLSSASPLYVLATQILIMQIRPAAAQEITRLLNRQATSTGDRPRHAYLTLEPSGCAEWTYRLTASPEPQQAITVLDCGSNISLAVSKVHLDLLKDLTIDYAEDLMGGGFRFINPIAQRTCGCGNAFALSAETSVAEDCTTPGRPTL